MVHSWMESGEVPSGLKKKLEKSGVSRENLWAEGLFEIPFAYNVITGGVQAMVLPLAREKREGWKASFGDEWITGTADFVGMLMEAPWVDDLKTGRRVEYLDYQAQQMFYALCWTKFQAGKLVECRSTITHWPKYPLDGVPRRFGVVIEPDTFREFEGKLRGLRASVLKLREKAERGLDVVSGLSDGPQCIYCPSKLACVKGQKYD